MRTTLILAMLLAAATASADTAGEGELGFGLGSFRLRGETMLDTAPELAGGIRAGHFGLFADAEHDHLLAPDSGDTATVNRIGWRARYELVFSDTHLRVPASRGHRIADGDVHFTQSVWLEGGTGEQFVDSDHVDVHRSDRTFGIGWMMVAYDQDDHPVRFGMYVVLRATFAAPIDADISARTTSPVPSSGPDGSYMFCVGYHV